MIAGPVLRTRALTTTGGRAVTLRVIRPEPTRENIQALRGVSDLWTAEARRYPPRDHQAALHAYFAADVAFLAASALVVRKTGRDTENVLVAVDDKDQVLGVTVYSWHPRRQVWELALQTTRPQDQPSSPNPDKVRGIGAELTGETLHQMNEQQCATVELECLDEAACAHWRRVGFMGATEPLHMTCSEAQLAARRYAHTPHDDPSRGDEFTAGDRDRLYRASAHKDLYRQGWTLQQEGDFVYRYQGRSRPSLGERGLQGYHRHGEGDMEHQHPGGEVPHAHNREEYMDLRSVSA